MGRIMDEAGHLLLATSADKGAAAMKECNSGEWLAEAKKRLERLEALSKRKEPAGVAPSTRQKLADDTRRSMRAEVRELLAAVTILRDEIQNESSMSNPK